MDIRCAPLHGIEQQILHHSNHRLLLSKPFDRRGRRFDALFQQQSLRLAIECRVFDEWVMSCDGRVEVARAREHQLDLLLCPESQRRDLIGVRRIVGRKHEPSVVEHQRQYAT